MHATFKNDATGELRNLKVGFSWTIFFFASFFAVPLFIRRLYAHAGVWFIFSILVFIDSFQATTATLNQRGPIGRGAQHGLIPDDIQPMVFIGLIVYNLYLAFAGNEMAARNYLTTGWRFADENSEVTQYAKRQWRLVQ